MELKSKTSLGWNSKYWWAGYVDKQCAVRPCRFDISCNETSIKSHVGSSILCFQWQAAITPCWGLSICELNCLWQLLAQQCLVPAVGYLRSWTEEPAAGIDISQDTFTNICTKLCRIFNSVVMSDLVNIQLSSYLQEINLKLNLQCHLKGNACTLSVTIKKNCGNLPGI